HAGINRKGFDLAKIAKILQALFTCLHPHGVENIARRDQYFAPDYFVLGPRVSDDVNTLDVGALALLTSIGKIDYSAVGRRTFRNNCQVDVTAAPIRVGRS